MLLRNVFHMNEQILEFLFEFWPPCCAISSSYSASLDLKGDKKTRATKISLTVKKRGLSRSVSI